MDYDQGDIAARYDTGRGYSADVLRQWLEALSDRVPESEISLILDLGCGTGRYSQALAGHFSAKVLALDPSQQMLDQARRKAGDSRVTYVHASGDALPTESGTVDMVFMSMVAHHLPDPSVTAQESHRVLRDGGHVCLRNSTTDLADQFPYIDFFPSAKRAIEQHLISQKAIRDAFEKAGFRMMSHQIIPHQLSPGWRDYADKLAKRADSILARISDAEFEAGLADIRHYAQRIDSGEPVMQGIDLFHFRK